MGPMLTIVIVVLSSFTDLSEGHDCKHEIKFQSNMSIRTWCQTKLEECSYDYLSSRFPPFFNATGWATVKPEPPSLTSYCQTDSTGVNRAGVNISWSPPMHSGARDITGFEVLVEGYRPGYKCILIILEENLTQSMIRSVFTGSIYPLKRDKHFSISLFSLPKSNMSVIVPTSVSTPKCENHNVSSHWKTTDFRTDYDGDKRTLNVSFPSPPDRFNFTHFSMTVTSVRNSKTFLKSTINQTFHVFHPIDVGYYRIFLTPDDPHPFDKSLCKCKDDRNRCQRCMTSRENITLTRGWPAIIMSTQGGFNSTRPTKIIINKIYKHKKQRGRKDRTTKKLLMVLLPSCIAVACVLLMTAIFLYVKRKLKRNGQCRKAEGSRENNSNNINVDQQDSRFVLLVNAADRHANCNSFHAEFYPIVQGMFGKTVAILHVGNTMELENVLRHCLTMSYKKDALPGNTALSTAANDHSKTCLIDGKQSSKFGAHLDCCGKTERHDNVIVVMCIFVDKNTSLKALESVKHVIDSLHSDIVDYSSLCVSFGKEDMPYSTTGMKRFSYKDDLSTILSFIKELLRNPGEQHESRECQEGIMATNKNTHSVMTKHLADKDDQSRELLNDHHTDECWRDWPGVVLVPRTPSSETTKRNRYLSNDSGWGTSENSFRSTPIEEFAETSRKSSTHSLSGADHDSLASPPRSDFFNIANRLGPSQITSTFSKPSAVSPRPPPDRSALKCPSDVFFFPPDDLSISEKQAAEKMLEAYAHQTALAGSECIPCTGSKGVQSKSERRCSPSIDSLMNMLKTINDESMHFMENEANAGDVYSVFEGVA